MHALYIDFQIIACAWCVEFMSNSAAVCSEVVSFEAFESKLEHHNIVVLPSFEREI